MRKKTKLLATTLGLGLTIGTLAFAFSFASSNVEDKAVEVNAELVYSKIYLVGNDNNWADPSTKDMTGYTFHYVGSKYLNGETSHYYELDINLTRDSTFKIRDWESGHESDWMASYDGTKVLQGLCNDDSGNLRCRMTGNYKITYRWTSSSNRCVEGFELNDSKEMFYIADNTTWAKGQTMYIHAWGSSGDNTYWGYGCTLNMVPSIKVGSSHYNFYRFKIPNDVTSFILKHYDGDTDYKTGNLSPSAGTCFSSNGYAYMGSAGAVIGNIYSHLGDYTYQGTSYSNSICAIDASTRGFIISAYDALGSDAKSIVDNAYLTTYNPNNLSETTNVLMSIIVQKLRINTINGLSRVVFPVSEELTKSGSLFIVIGSVTLLVALGGFFFLKKKRA